MTVSSEVSSVSYAGDAVTLAFTIPFRFLSSADISVVRRAADLSVTELTAGFSITGAGGATGTCTFVTAPAADVDIIISRAPEFLQPGDYTANDAFPAEATETLLDRQTMLSQYLRRLVNHCIAVPFGDSLAGSGVELPSADSRANKYLAFGASGNIELAELTSSGDLSSTIIATTLDSLKRTAAEIAAGVTPKNYAYPELWAERYGATGDGATDDIDAFTDAFSVADEKNGGIVRYGWNGGVFMVGAPIVIPEHCGLDGPGATGYGAMIKALASFNLPTRGIIESANALTSDLQEWAPIRNVYVVGNRTGGAVCKSAILWKNIFINSAIRDCVIEDVDGDGIRLETGGGPVELQNLWINNITGTSIRVTDAFIYVRIRDVALERWGDTATSGTQYAISCVSATASEVGRFLYVDGLYSELKPGKNHDCIFLQNIFYAHLTNISAGGGTGGETGSFIRIDSTAGGASYAYPLGANSRGVLVEQSWAGGASPSIYTNHINDEVNGIVRTERYIPRYLMPEPIITIGSTDAPAFANSWVDRGGGNQASGYFIDSDGFVNLVGGIKDGSVGSAAFTLPVGARPVAGHEYIVASNSTTGLLTVSSAGVVTPISPSNNTYVSLDGVRFKALH